MAKTTLPAIPDDVQELIFRTLKFYANQTSYEAPRIGGVTAGCPRGETPSPSELVEHAAYALKKWPAAESALCWENVAAAPTLLAQRDALMGALTELVACKDLKDEESRLRQRRDVAIKRDGSAVAEVDAMRHDYNRRKPLAWERARTLIAEIRGGTMKGG